MSSRGIFLLENVRSRQREGDWVPLPSVWGRDGLQHVGYVVGGADGSNNLVSYYQSITYSNDTRSNVANLPQGRSGVYGLASPINGYAVGGGSGHSDSPGTYYSSSNKLSFSTQTNSALPGVNMGESFGRGGSAGSSTAGYIAGGYSNPGEPSGWSRLEKLTYSTETIARIPGSNLPGVGYGGATGWDQAATGNGNLFGVWIGGNIYPSPNPWLSGTAVFKLGYSTDQWNQSSSWNLTTGNRLQKAGMSSSDTGAYIVGGAYPNQTRVQKISFADMTNSVVTNSASPGRTDLTGTGTPGLGYYAGGAEGNNNNGTGGSITSIVEKMNFSTESISRIPSLDLANSLSKTGSMSATGDNKILNPQYRWVDNAPASFNFGYSMTGKVAPYPANHQTMQVTYKIDYGTDTSANLPSGAVSYGYYEAFGGGDSLAAYKMGGLSSDVPSSGSEISEKVVYATDLRQGLPNYGGRRYGSFVVTHGETALYGVGGRGGAGNLKRSDVYKMLYSSETWSTIPGTNDDIETGRRDGASMASATHGYFAGGGNVPGNPASPEYRSDVDKMTFASETTDRIPSANLLSNVVGNKGWSDSTAAYSASGNDSTTYLSRIEKISFATDTTELFTSGSLPAPMVQPQTMTSDTTAFNAGGNAYPGGYKSSVTKLWFATGTLSASGNLPTFQYSGVGASAGNDNLPFQAVPPATPTPGTSPLADSAPNFGVAGGGDVIPGGAYTLFDKLEYSTETNSTLPSSDATAGTNGYTQRSITSLTEGWSNSANGTHLWKFVYATSTQNPSPASHTNRNHADGLTFSNKTEGYFGSGANVGSPGPSYSGGPANSLDKFTFSTSTISQVPDLSASPSNANHDFNTSNIGNQNAGYYSGGNSRSVGKYVYATSTSTMTNNFIAENSTNPMGVGNATNGYIVAGDRSSTDRIAYSTDTHTKLPGASYPPGDQTWGGGSHSSSDAGYIQGGRSPSAPNSPFNYHWSNTRKLTYSTETLTELPASADISVGRNDYSGMSARQNNNGSSSPAPNVI